MTDVDWRSMDRETRSAAYDNRAAVTDSAARLARWQGLSATLRLARTAELDVPYGPLPRNRIDIFPAAQPDAPLLVFIHGGYWQRNAKEDFACFAMGPLAKGMAVALPGYTLAPAASLTTIVDEVGAALCLLRARDERAGGRRRVIVSGWSAGGHLAALAAKLPGVDAVLAISGVYDLTPLRGTTIDDAVRLTAAEVTELSPMRCVTAAASPLVVAYGNRELPELRRQAQAYHAACAAAARPTQLLDIEDADHFSVLEHFLEPEGALTRAAHALGRG